MKIVHGWSSIAIEDHVTWVLLKIKSRFVWDRVLGVRHREREREIEPMLSCEP